MRSVVVVEEEGLHEIGVQDLGGELQQSLFQVELDQHLKENKKITTFLEKSYFLFYIFQFLCESFLSPIIIRLITSKRI